MLRSFFLLVFVFLAGCATVDFDYPKTKTHTIQNTDDTYLGRTLAPLTAKHPGHSGFHLLVDGIDALAARLVMAARAERSIDTQYYLVTNDAIGSLYIRSLLLAADRGVRVRLLLDDIQTQGYDVGMAALDSHPNFEVRIFNPFSGRSGRFADAFDIGRVNRRMHNKSFTADNQITLIGGRNIAAEYFAARHDVNFADADVLAVGPVVEDVSQMFDLYWNSYAALPVPAFAKMPDDPAAELDKLRARLEANFQAVLATPYAEAVKADIKRYTGKGEREIYWAPHVLAYDSPDKAIKDKAEQSATILTPLRESVLGAKRELIIISPYFVPRKTGIKLLGELQERGVQVTVITNSLAANNHAIVHAGYAPSRKPLLELGVKIYEYKSLAPPSGVDRGGAGASLATLHTKAFLVDREEFFLGSFNWDPRSAYINTELGVIIKSAPLGKAVDDQINKILNEVTYEVVLDEDGELKWIDRSSAEPVFLYSEPDTGFWRQFSVELMKLLPIRGQL